jgi:hypothetical protein
MLILCVHSWWAASVWSRMTVQLAEDRFENARSRSSR